jgi:hypothetical protein
VIITKAANDYHFKTEQVSVAVRLGQRAGLTARIAPMKLLSSCILLVAFLVPFPISAQQTLRLASTDRLTGSPPRRWRACMNRRSRSRS